MRAVIVTGSAGLIGSETVKRFAQEGARVVGIDNDMRAQFFGGEASTKKTRDDLIANFPSYEHHDLDIRDAGCSCAVPASLVMSAGIRGVPRKYRPMDPDAFGNFPIRPKERERVYYVTPDPEAIRAMDPSEAVTGFKLPKLLESVFKIIEKKPAGGSLMMNMGGHIPFDLPNGDPNCAAWISLE